MRLLPILAFFTLASGTSAVLNAQQSSPTLPLEVAIRTALQKNQDIKVEAYAPEIARANVLTALGQFDPALTFDRSYSVVDTPLVPGSPLTSQVKTDDYSLALQGTLPTGLTYSIGGTAENQRGTANSFTNQFATFGGINLTQPLLRGFGWGANLVNVRVAKANRAISNWDYRQTLIDTVTDVVIAYSNLVLAHHQLDIALHSRELAQTLLRGNLQELKIGNLPLSDVTAARAQVAAREESILLAENAVRSADNQLRQLMGETSFPPDRPLLAVASPSIPDVTIDLEKDIRDSFSKRPDYQAARLGITINRAKFAAARNLLLPQVNLVAGYGYDGLDANFAASRRMVGSRDFPSSSIGVAVSLPITNAQGRGQARAARFTLEQSEANLALLEANIALDVTNAAAQIETTRKRVLVDRAAVALANKALDDEVKKFRDGISNTLLVVQSQGNLIGVEINVANALAAEEQAVAIYDRALGRTLIRYHIDIADR